MERSVEEKEGGGGAGFDDGGGVGICVGAGVRSWVLTSVGRVAAKSPLQDVDGGFVVV